MNIICNSNPIVNTNRIEKSAKYMDFCEFNYYFIALCFLRTRHPMIDSTIKIVIPKYGRTDTNRISVLEDV